MNVLQKKTELSSEEVKEPFLRAFSKIEKGGGKDFPEWLKNLRQNALSKFAILGFPNTHHEAWKYTSVETIIHTLYQFLTAETAKNLASKKDLNSLPIPLSGPTLVFVNGFFSRDLSKLNLRSSSLKIGSLKEAILKDPDGFKEYFPSKDGYENSIFRALNMSLFEDGAFVHIPPNFIFEEPIHLVFIAPSSQKNLISFPRNLIVAESGSKATIIESYVSFPENTTFSNAFTQVIVKNEASINYYQIQNQSEKAFHVGETEMVLNEKTHLSHCSLTLSGRIVRNNLSVQILGRESEANLTGLYLTSHEQHVDNTTVIDHKMGESTSRQLYKGVLNGKSTGVFSGKIFVRKNAQKTDAAQTNKNLLLSKEAKVDMKPQLEIFANDVKCTHGAAVGELEDHLLFYLQSRGLGSDTARHLLIRGFIHEVTDQIKVQKIKDYLNRVLLTPFEEGKEALR
ncbi:MAG: Fe-S cluster assembly protein SufD [Chlamydiae bacterium]|nr:Fe-S cluster assembly protein SufD [Chlamydiota bacterium]MBI3276267.1 Fe-S cluster assembly protein SufD [Chlamydiota bacterium]